MSDLHALAVVRREACLVHCDPLRIHGYCANCPNFGARWSCPPFAVPPLDSLGAWCHAVLVARKVMLEKGPDSSAKDRKDWALSRFHTSRAEFRKILMAAEAEFPGSTALVAGHCTCCETCARPGDIPCHSPKLMRISLEAAGFDVSNLAADLLGVAPQWPSVGLPAYYLTVGAILCLKPEMAKEIRKNLDDRFSVSVS